jgi:hypothetical protein
VWQQDLTCPGQSYGPGVAFEQGLADLPFQFADLLADRWLGDSQPGRGAGEMAFFGDHDKNPQLV